MTASDTASVRHTFYLLLLAVAVGIAAAKVVGAENVLEPSRFAPAKEGGYSRSPAEEPPTWPRLRPEPMPTFSSNDRSRWATIRALVEEGTYVIGRRKNVAATDPPYGDEGIVFEDGYGSIDKVMNRETGEYYSSKPPLFPTVLAGEYWLLKQLFGWSIDRDRWLVVCTILLTVNVLPFGIALWLLSRLIEEYGTTDIGRMFVFTTACCGTFLTTFMGTLNNHTPAACCVFFALYPLLRKGGDPESPARLAVSGFFAGLLPTLELPGLALSAGLLAPLLWTRPLRTLVFFLLPALVPIVAASACEYAARGRLMPAYSEFGGPEYNYPGSHWAKAGTPAARGIDFADEPKHVYAFHLLFGHHGWFSLTPVFLVSAFGILVLAWQAGPQVGTLLARRRAGPEGVWTLPLLGALTLAVSVVVFAFYVWRTNNYGGFTSGPRWLFWLIPPWLLCTLPAADRLGEYRAGRILAAVLLGFAVLSVFYPAWNPWRPPWVLQFLEVNGWLAY